MSIGNLVAHAEPLLTSEEETRLARAMEAGVLAREALERASGIGEPVELRLLEGEGQRARERFLLSNLKLVAMVACREAGRSGLDPELLFSDGFLGLVVAVERFDHRQGNRFATYALPWIKARVAEAVASRCGTSHASPHDAIGLRRLRAVLDRIAQVEGRAASVHELADELGRSAQWVSQMVDFAEPCSLHERFEQLIEVPAPSEEPEDRQEPLRRSLARLEARRRRVIELRFGFVGARSHTYTEIARVLGMPVNRVRRLEREGMETLRSTCRQELALSG